MGLKNIVKNGLFSGLNPMRWVGLDQIKGNGQSIANITKKLFKNNKIRVQLNGPNTFAEAMRRYGLSEKDLQERMRSTLRLAYVFCLAGLIMGGYTIYLFAANMILSGFVATMLTLLLWAYAFREHFNYFQMKQRRLGCTFRAWFSYILKRSK